MNVPLFVPCKRGNLNPEFSLEGIFTQWKPKTFPASMGCQIAAMVRVDPDTEEMAVFAIRRSGSDHQGFKTIPGWAYSCNDAHPSPVTAKILPITLTAEKPGFIQLELLCNDELIARCDIEVLE